MHPYGKQVEAVTDQVEAFREVSVKAKDKSATLWVTETGWSSTKGGNPLNVGAKGQAKRLKESFKFFKKNRKKLKIQQVDWYSYKDSTTGGLRLVRDLGPVHDLRLAEAGVDGVHEVHRR